MFERIVSDPAVLGGKPCIRGTRISVEMILEWIASGGTSRDIIEAYPHLTTEDVVEAIRFAASNLKGEVEVISEVAG